MSKLDLTQYTDREIVEALVKLEFPKMISIMTAISKTADRVTRRGETISKQITDDDIDNMMRRIIEGGEK